MSSKKITNFNIVNYVHLTYANAIKDKNLKGRRVESQLKKKYNRIYKDLEKRFTEIVGVSSKEFLKVCKKMDQGIETINKMFTSSSLQELEGYLSDDKIKKLKLSRQDAEELSHSAKIIGFSNILGKIYSKETTPEEFENIANGFSGIDAYEQILNYLNSSSAGQKNSNNKKKQSMMLYLLTEISKNVGELRVAATSSSTFNIPFDWSNKSLDDFNTLIARFQDGFKNGIPIKMKDIEQITSIAKRISDTQIKGALVGEYSSAILAKNLFFPLLKKDLTDKLKVTHSGKDIQSTKTITFNPSSNLLGINTAQALDILESLKDRISNIQVIDKKADIIISYKKGAEEKNIPISVKTYKSAAKWINLSDKISIGAALAFGENGTEIYNYYLNSGITAKVFNALNFYLLQNEYGVFKEGEIAKVTKIKNATLASTKIDNAFGGVLSSLAMDILGNLLQPESSAFIDINGIFIPTPIYYKYMMDRFMTREDIYANSFLYFNASAYLKNTESLILNEQNTGAQLEPGSKNNYRYDLAALKRNIIVRNSIINHKISIRTNFIQIEEFKKLL